MDVIVDQFKHRVEISFLDETYLDGHLSLDCTKMKESLVSRLTTLDFQDQLKDVSEFLGCVILIFSSSDQSPIYSLVPSKVKIPVPVFLGILLLRGPTFFVSLVNDMCGHCDSSPCSCDPFPDQSHSNEVSLTTCRCGENKKLSKSSCFGTKRCPCFSNSKGCNICKCKNCNNPFGKRNLEIVKTSKNQSPRYFDAKASHAGKLLRKIDPIEYGRVKPDWNIFEKILLRRIFLSSTDKETSSIHALYCQYSNDKKSIYIRMKTIDAVKKALNKLQLQV